MAAATALLAAFGAAAPTFQPSALRVQATAIVALLAPLFWPGVAARRGATVLRVAAWSAGAGAAAAVALWVYGHGAQPASRVLGPCLMLAALMVPAHAAAAMLEVRWQAQGQAAADAREAAGRSVAGALSLLASLPLWAGPASELLAAQQPAAVDAALALSPLTHLAVASGNDLLRNPWLYAHSNLAALPFAYPGLSSLAWFYAALCGALALLARAWLRQGAAAHALPRAAGREDAA